MSEGPSELIERVNLAAKRFAEAKAAVVAEPSSSSSSSSSSGFGGLLFLSSFFQFFHVFF
jgi:hypothetical protein